MKENSERRLPAYWLFQILLTSACWTRANKGFAASFPGPGCIKRP